jgi:hypothetical protein
MTPYDIEDVSTNTLAEAEEAVMRVAHKQRPTTLEELRDSLEHSRVRFDRQILNLALLSLLNSNRLTLTPGRQLEVGE